ncbi:sn-glycerol-3-phosphate ABC transporter ATP-binding protein UgpC [Roseateles asaccharophilus]|uniref:Multiple sugar transport system ATP-binding protein n=1 Tax=Roseateles asaccharophilus TaxID=582607 RepID=A0ABU2ADQ3_9BURK|nr:sn-glycerol-3-phosphate ABC transporter ATP-binding protein UgpC [Roseateles asaccharophilus]MDR7335329.1 multiple sugar transport system ATP-binding protein [Roseateles asaccharophilus]
MTASIQFAAVAKRYGPVDVIPDFSLDIAAGEFIVLLGPSGCGKSTLLRMLAGLESVSDGRIVLGGTDVTDLPPGKRGLAMVFQQYALYPHMSVFDNMAFGLRNIGVADAQVQQRVTAAAQMLELDALLQRKPGQLSGGQRQRVAIGRAVVKEPKAFLFDEPLSNLDAKLRSRTRIEIARLHKRLGSTMVFVTHDQVEAMTLADRIVVMNGGRIEQLGAPMEIYQKPRTKFVAGFVGSPAMNFLPVERVPDDQGRAVVRLYGGELLRTQVAASDALGRELCVGVRPEGLKLAEAGVISGGVELIERLGERSLAHVGLGNGTVVVAEVPVQRPLALGDVVHLQPDLDQLHVFDASGVAHHAEVRAA